MSLLYTKKLDVQFLFALNRTTMDGNWRKLKIFFFLSFLFTWTLKRWLMWNEQYKYYTCTYKTKAKNLWCFKLWFFFYLQIESYKCKRDYILKCRWSVIYQLYIQGIGLMPSVARKFSRQPSLVSQDSGYGERLVKQVWKDKIFYLVISFKRIRR